MVAVSPLKEDSKGDPIIGATSFFGERAPGEKPSQSEHRHKLRGAEQGRERVPAPQTPFGSGRDRHPATLVRLGSETGGRRTAPFRSRRRFRVN